MFTIKEIIEVALFFAGSIGFFFSIHAMLGRKRWGIPAFVGSLCALIALFVFKY